MRPLLRFEDELSGTRARDSMPQVTGAAALGSAFGDGPMACSRLAWLCLTRLDINLIATSEWPGHMSVANSSCLAEGVCVCPTVIAEPLVASVAPIDKYLIGRMIVSEDSQHRSARGGEFEVTQTAVERPSCAASGETAGCLEGPNLKRRVHCASDWRGD